MNPTTKSTAAALEKLRKQKMVLEARIQATEARLKQDERKKDTRRKILIGSYYLDKAIKENSLSELNKRMSEYLTRETDRNLFEALEE